MRVGQYKLKKNLFMCMQMRVWGREMNIFNLSLFISFLFNFSSKGLDRKEFLSKKSFSYLTR